MRRTHRQAHLARHTVIFPLVGPETRYPGSYCPLHALEGFIICEKSSSIQIALSLFKKGDTMTPSRDKQDSAIDKRDFDAHRPLLDDADAEADEQQRGHLRSRAESCLSATNNDDGLLNDVVDEILERDRKKMAKEVVRVSSFAWGVISW